MSSGAGREPPTTAPVEGRGVNLSYPWLWPKGIGRIPGRTKRRRQFIFDWINELHNPPTRRAHCPVADWTRVTGPAVPMLAAERDRRFPEPTIFG